ncbi:MAG: 2-hydroxychromene-2-carboxylate isomerase [Gammaproteobacteria bacterium]|nr:2-hydroxychromene-2-carboxylate isomerase [Gammaproteobacteria bacterium]
MAEVTFFYTYGCPWTRLAFARLREVALRTSARIVWKPILIEELGRHRATAGPATDPARASYAKKDLADWAEFCGVRMRHAGPFPVPALWAQRGAVVAQALGRIEPYSECVFEACFNALEDIDSLDVVAACAVAAGLDRAEFIGRAGDPVTRELLESNTHELKSRGGFGSPTMFVGENMFFGNDRMPLVELALNRCAERPLVAPGAHGQR